MATVGDKGLTRVPLCCCCCCWLCR